MWGHDVVEPTLNANSVLDTTPVGASRGDILGADGVALVTERPVVRVGIDRATGARRPGDPRRRASPGAAGRRRRGAATSRRSRRPAPKAFVEAITYRQEDLPPRGAAGLRGHPGRVPGRRPTSRWPRPADFAAPILGTVGPVTAEMIADDPDRYEAGDVAGLSGLQARYDEQLQGTPGVVVNAVGSDGKERELFRSGGAEGEPLQLTLDERLQSEAEAILADVGPASALVAIRPSDGAVLAAANGPGNDGQNLATFGQYAPGSTFKSVSSLALLRRGLTPDSLGAVHHHGRRRRPRLRELRRLPRRRHRPASRSAPRWPTPATPPSSPSAPGCAKGDLAAAAASLGLGIDHDLGLPGLLRPVEPPTTETGRAADMIGQGTVLASPMAMATVIASVQAGQTVVPRLVEQVEVSVARGGRRRSRPPRPRRSRRCCAASSPTAAAACWPTSRAAPVIAKTGTAEFEDGGQIRTHAWMIAAQGDLAVAVFVAEGSSGSGTAGPLLEAFLRAAGLTSSRALPLDRVLSATPRGIT